ncbi:hypothetical protein HB848_08455 [Listeria rocourtiae]|uniref:hypothetical protein n=1 Tax=Listeria rocourtiae TaxID=647910 RepID=UPI00162473CD|nr:hypothetical protein [Listeria rocourtiae]MBC1435370.1 hypothetical protein [Listeria rocourtiae]
MTALTYTLQDFVPQHSFTGPRIPIVKTLTSEEILSAVPGTQFEIDEQQDLQLVAMGVFQDQTTPIVLEGLSFNLKERANFGLQFIRCAEVTIRHCRFYGYNPDRFITHGATDSNVLFQDCPMVTLEGNEFGPNDGIGTDADVLNRCITIQGTPVGSTIYRITDNLFSSVNQGIVALGDVFGATPDQFYLEGNRFYDVQEMAYT